MEIDLGQGFEALLGYIHIDQKNNTNYYYFMPIAKIGNSALKSFDPTELERLVKILHCKKLQSPKPYVNLFYNTDKDDEEALMRVNFPENSLILITANLIYPPKSFKNMPFTTVDAISMIRKIGISRIHNYKVFHVISPSDLNGKTVDSQILPDEQIYVKSDGFYFGPYPVDENRSISFHPDDNEKRHSDNEYVEVLLPFSLNNKQGFQLVIPKKPNTNTLSEQPRQAPLFNSDKDQLTQEIAQLKQELEILKQCQSLEDTRKLLNQKKATLEELKSQVSVKAQELDIYFNGLIEAQHQKMLDIAFDGFLSNKMLKAAAQWEAEDNEQAYEGLVEAVNQIGEGEESSMEPQDLIDYLCSRIQLDRPQYDDNTIINIAICMTQGFLTVFSGEPGCGKTSICNLFANALGLTQFRKAIPEDINIPEDMKASANRYLSVSVEQGWTSKRDFIGYYNPLSKTFDKSNRRVYDAIRQLDIEKRKGKKTYPFIILLDEANLSPMEYYWADFMNICDSLEANSEINLGESYVYRIPETLHFLATINNDHTTETLSPRLIDRAWIITLPKFIPQSSNSIGTEVPELGRCAPKIITWDALAHAFRESSGSPNDKFPADIYEEIITHLKELHISISPRVDIAIKRYWAAAAKHFKQENGIEPQIIALDYAVAQKILPKIFGNGKEYEDGLEHLRSLFKKHALNKSEEIVKDIIEHGNQQMNYYQFFCKREG